MPEDPGHGYWPVGGLAPGKEFRFCAFRSKNQNKSRRGRNATELFRSSMFIFIEEESARNQPEIRFLGRVFAVLVS